jgi:hypothetical protein
MSTIQTQRRDPPRAGALRSMRKSSRLGFGLFMDSIATDAPIFQEKSPICNQPLMLDTNLLIPQARAGAGRIEEQASKVTRMPEANEVALGDGSR